MIEILIVFSLYSIYIFIFNIRYTKKLLPDIQVSEDELTQLWRVIKYSDDVSFE